MPSILISNNNTLSSVSIDGVPFDPESGISAVFAEEFISAAVFEAGILLTSGEIKVVKAYVPVVTYRCVLTGAANGFPDITIPIASFQIRKRVL